MREVGVKNKSEAIMMRREGGEENGAKPVMSK